MDSSLRKVIRDALVEVDVVVLVEFLDVLVVQLVIEKSPEGPLLLLAKMRDQFTGVTLPRWDTRNCA